MPDDLFDLLERRTFSSDSLVGGMLHDQAVEIKRLRKIVWSVVHNLQHADDTTPRDEVGPLCGPTWGKVAYVCGLGSTSAIALCREFGVDPDYDCTEEDCDGQ